MTSAVPQDVHAAHGMNRWTLEPLLSFIWILTLASGLLAFAAPGLGASLAVVLGITLWAAAAVVWSRVRAARNAR